MSFPLDPLSIHEPRFYRKAKRMAFTLLDLSDLLYAITHVQPDSPSRGERLALLRDRLLTQKFAQPPDPTSSQTPPEA